MYAVFRHGSRQYRAKQGDVITIDHSAGTEPGSRIEFGRVLAHNGKVGAPALDGITVVGEVVDHPRGKKLYIQKFRRRKNYRRLTGHRQDYTRVRITEILGGPAPQAAPVAEHHPSPSAAPESTPVATDQNPAPHHPTEAVPTEAHSSAASSEPSGGTPAVAAAEPAPEAQQSHPAAPEPPAGS